MKTVLRLIPLIFFIMPILTFHKQPQHLPFNIHVCNTTTVKFYLTILESIIALTWLPIYQFLICPFLYNCIPSRLKRIGLGMLVLAVSNLLVSTLNLIVLEPHQENNNNTMINNVIHPMLDCAFSESWWFILTFINDLGILIVAITTIEFSMAQAPCQVRGLVSAIILASYGIFGVPTALLRFFYTHNHFVDVFRFVDGRNIHSFSDSIKMVQTTQEK